MASVEQDVCKEAMTRRVWARDGWEVRRPRTDETNFR